MLILSSPAKTFDEESPIPDYEYTVPDFLSKTKKLHKYLESLSQKDLREKLDVSENLAELNYERYQNWVQNHTEENSRPALFMYAGDVFKQLDLESYGKEELNYAQNSVRVISGFYGLVKAMDLIQPYRLEMHTKLSDFEKESLYDFWTEDLTEALEKEVEEGDHNLVLNLASNAYAKALNLDDLGCEVIKADFKEKREGELRTIGILAKRARGMMIDHCISKKASSKMDLKDFSGGGYEFKEETEGGDLLFVNS